MSSSKLRWHGGGGHYWATTSNISPVRGIPFEIDYNTSPAFPGYRYRLRRLGLVSGPTTLHHTVKEAKAAAETEWRKHWVV